MTISLPLLWFISSALLTKIKSEIISECMQHHRFNTLYLNIDHALQVATSELLNVPNSEYPSCLHTTLASSLSQPLSQIVPQEPLTQISTRPSLSYVDPESLTSPSSHLAVKIESY